MARLTFHGAAETVTGSKYLLEADGKKILIDCGLFQGLKALRQKNWDALPFEVAELSAIVLTHAHVDHIGYLPRMVHFGYDGPVYCTRGTDALAGIMLFDAAKIQEYDAEYANRKKFSKHHPALPLFTTDHAAQSLKLLAPVDRDTWFTVAGKFRCRYHDAGHLLGSAMIEVQVSNGGGRPLTILFSGDVGRYDAPLYHDPATPPPCDYLVCESTYGNRDHPHVDLRAELAETVNAAVRRGGVMLVAAFAVGRAQQLMYLLHLLMREGKIPQMPVFLDSPMAAEATRVYCAHTSEQDHNEVGAVDLAQVFSDPNVHLARTAEESKRINNIAGPAVIIASSGMMTGGRILHHLEQRLPDARNTVLLGGFMAEGTRGRVLEDGAKRLRMHGRDVPVRAAIVKNSGLSCHAGRSELLRWLEPLASPKRVFITHGERDSALAFAAELRARRGWDAHVPRLGETVDLEMPS